MFVYPYFPLYSSIPWISVHFKINSYQNVNAYNVSDFVLINQLCSKLRGATEKNNCKSNIREKENILQKGNCERGFQ